MAVLSTILIIYGLFCIVVALTKMPLIWNLQKLRIMSKMFKGDRNLQTFIFVWGLIAFAIGILIR